MIKSKQKECSWNPSKHEGKACPTHQGGSSFAPDWDTDGKPSKDDKNNGKATPKKTFNKNLGKDQINQLKALLKQQLRSVGAKNGIKDLDLIEITKIAVDEINLFAYLSNGSRLVVELETNVSHLEIKPPFTDDSNAVVIWQKNGNVPEWDV